MKSWICKAERNPFLRMAMRIMGRSYILAFLVISAVFGRCFSEGYSRKEMRFGNGASLTQVDRVEGIGRAMMEFTMDYEEPGANTNPSSGFILAPPPAAFP